MCEENSKQKTIKAEPKNPLGKPFGLSIVMDSDPSKRSGKSDNNE
jgi:hypothetical protein